MIGLGNAWKSSGYTEKEKINQISRTFLILSKFDGHQAKSTDIRIQHETETAKFHQDSEMLEEVGVTVEHPSGFRGENSMEIHSPSQLNALSVAASISLDILNTIQIPYIYKF